MSIPEVNDKIKIYSDIKCFIPINSIKWDSSFEIVLVDGTKETIPNTAVAGQTVIATFYIRNESEYRFGVTKIYHPDNRIKLSIGNPWLIPHNPIKMTLTFIVPLVVSPDDVIKTGQVQIEGYFIYGL